ncbi:chaperone protein [Pseudanabaena phage Pam3]|nr:chaperone protein [Pseudanabaena phage Pam3]
MAEKKFGNRTFQVGDVLATEAVELQCRFLQIVGGGVDRLPTILAGAGDAAQEAKDASSAALVAALADIFSKCEPKRVTGFIKDVVGYCQIMRPSGSWEQVDLDGEFTQKEHRRDLYPVVLWALQEILSDFFAGLLANGALQKVLRA